MLSRNIQRGDTLIEVLFAFTILSMVIVGAIAMMNQGTNATQRSLETTLVRAEIDSQATTIRFLHDAYVAGFKPNGSYPANTPAGQWVAMTSVLNATSASSFANPSRCPTPPTGSFILDAGNARYVPGTSSSLIPATAIAQVTYNLSGSLRASEGIWVEAIRSQAESDVNKQNTRYIDFHIRACWESPGQGAPSTIGTIVRLYEPRS